MLLMAPLHQAVMKTWIQSFEKCEYIYFIIYYNMSTIVSGVALHIECKLTYLMLLHRNPEWGLPDIDVLRQLAYGNGMRLERMVSHIL